MGRYIRTVNSKHPKLKMDMDVQLSEYLSTELVDTLLHDDLDRIVEITKYVPQMVRVENVYTYDSEKTRKVEFHLKILLKALLAELLRIKEEFRADIVIDEGIIGMIHGELEGIVDAGMIDSILAMYRSVPKTRDVPKIIEKVAVETYERPNHIILDNKSATVQPLNKV
jgi:hypothetical protein